MGGGCLPRFSSSNSGRRSCACRPSRFRLPLLVICACILLASLATKQVNATSWFYRFFPVQREEHARLEALKQGRHTGKEEIDETEGGREIREFEEGTGSRDASAPSAEEGILPAEFLPPFLRRFLPPRTSQAAQVNVSRENERRSTVREDIEVKEGWFEQPLDHGNPLVFNRPQHAAWRQKFYSAKRKRPSCQKREQARNEHGSLENAERSEQGQACPDDAIRPVFVYIGGEGPLSSMEVKQGLLAEMGEAFGASVYALEHRYYGDSHPRPDSSVPNLQWLTSHQALGDLAAFVAHVKREQAEQHPQNVSPEDIPVIVFGCSYPGSLAAYARSKYPASILGAISSSSPVEASALFQAFDQTVQRVLPSACTSQIKAATAIVERRIFTSEEEAVKVAAKFGCGAEVSMKTHDQRVALLYVIADAVAQSVQYNRNPKRPWIDEVCNCFAEAPPARTEKVGNEDTKARRSEEDELLDALAKAVQLMLAELKMTCKDSNMLQLADTRLGPQASASARLWVWQSCAEYGYWQVAYKGSVRSRLIDLNWHLRMCDALFPLPSGSKFSTDVVDETNVWSGDKHVVGVGAATNIHFTNGENDPWAPLSVTEISPFVTERQGLSSFTIKNGSHCNDFYAYEDGTEPLPVTEAKARIQRAIRLWLEDFQARHAQRRARNTPETNKGISRGENEL
ncbi:protein F23B2.12, partially confirmed by transcript evidence, related [Neospora caninum Liverpool]|uniref:Protein F23B2.12, partially confirmed by transcript evidence, related n=1 Tax=Neospora caninum (strain Liverpool) TaxID=572307 RepID=F0V9D7_NEOCL